MITCREVAAGSRGLRLYRIDAEPEGVAAPGLGLDPMALLFERTTMPAMVGILDTRDRRAN